MPHIEINNNRLGYSIRYSKRAKYINIAIHAERGLELVVPHGRQLSQHHAEQILTERYDWISSTLNRLDKRLAQRERTRLQYHDGALFPLLGNDYPLRVVQSTKYKTTKIVFNGLVFKATCPPASHEEELQAAMEKCYRKLAKQLLPLRVAMLNHGWLPRVERVAIRGQKTRWGSCSTNKNINLNYRLLLAPTAVVDYVIIHELCHLIEMNHSKRFWQLLEDFMPQYKRHRKWLRQHSASLQL